MPITPEFVKEQERLHLDPTYGAGGWRYAYLVAGILRVHNCKSWLDYGCGKGTLLQSLRIFCNQELINVTEWDPGRVGKREWTPDEPRDLVTCIDVMEHIEPKSLDSVLDHLTKLTGRFLFLDISLKFDKHRWLTDGRNSHQIVDSSQKWLERFGKKGFQVRQEWPSDLKSWVVLLEKK